MSLTPLPIDPLLPQLVRAARQRGAVVLTAPPGSGKTTRAPAALLDALSDGAVWVLEPRRLAARAAARRVAAERGVEVGAEVGYQVRHERRAGQQTRLRFVTEGVLLRHLLADPFLAGIAAVVLDEFHERHAEGDLALAMLREVRETVRPDLVLLVMSATLLAEPLVRFLGAEPLASQGTLFDVRTIWAERAETRSLAPRAREAVAHALAETTGDVLVFLPGMREIRAVARELEPLARAQDLLVLPLHGDLSPEEQDRAVLPQPQRKVVLATNVAESSITIEGVSAVVDSGLVRMLRHDPGRGLDVLKVESCSLASADQRRGRAGRTGPGVCYRLWTRAEERARQAFDTPELLRIDLCGPALAVRRFSGRDPRTFGWFEPPDAAALERADRLLLLLGAIDGEGRVTRQGEAMLALPLHPRLARVVLAARAQGCVREAAGLAAILSERDFVARDAPAGDGVESSAIDRLRRLDEARAARFEPRTCERLGVAPAAARAVARAQDQIAGKAPPAAELVEADLARALLAGFPDRVARRSPGHPGTATLVGGRPVQLAPDAVPDGTDLLLAIDVRDRGGEGRGRPLVTIGMQLDLDWLAEMAPAALRVADEPELDRQAGRVWIWRRRRYLDLLLDEQQLGPADAEAARPLLLPLLTQDLGGFLGEQKELQHLRARIGWLRQQAADAASDLPVLDDETVADLTIDLADARGLSALHDADVPGLVFARWPQLRARLDRECPERVALPSGRRAPIDYAAPAGPTVSARLQELFGLREPPRLAGGRVALVVELLAPNMRPVQVTRDLPSFWSNVYPKVRSELMRRYPRHDWPEDPLSAKPQARPRRRR